MSGYCIPAGAGEAEFTEKRSRFLGHVRPVESEEEARAFIADTKKEFYDARHNCWCYRLQDGPERYSDDGEPQGSAGLPMLEVFRREGVTNCVCVVTRYFGGVLLGTGGLLRAYTKSARDALEAAGRARVDRWLRLEVRCPYGLLERVKNELAALEGLVESMDYGADVALTLLLGEDKGDAFAARLTDLSGGSLRARALGESFRAVPIDR